MFETLDICDKAYIVGNGYIYFALSGDGQAPDISTMNSKKGFI